MNKFHTLNIKGQLLALDKPLVMGILNATPDSFYEKSRVSTHVLKHCESMLQEGATFLDIGGQSTRPGASRIEAAEELNRVIPVIREILREFPGAILSIDTFYSEVAHAAVGEGAALVNDISSGSIDPKMFETIAALHVPYVLMHMQGTPETMQLNPQYADVVGEVSYFFSDKIRELHALGVTDIILDPGFGFGKTLEQNYAMLKHFEEFGIFNCPLLAGVSRKGMIQKVIGTDAEHALNGTTAAHMIALMHGAKILRVHDVKEAAEAIAVYDAMRKA